MFLLAAVWLFIWGQVSLQTHSQEPWDRSSKHEKILKQWTPIKPLNLSLLIHSTEHFCRTCCIVFHDFIGLDMFVLHFCISLLRLHCLHCPWTSFVYYWYIHHAQDWEGARKCVRYIDISTVHCFALERGLSFSASCGKQSVAQPLPSTQLGQLSTWCRFYLKLGLTVRQAIVWECV